MKIFVYNLFDYRKKPRMRNADIFMNSCSTTYADEHQQMYCIYFNYMERYVCRG